MDDFLISAGWACLITAGVIGLTIWGAAELSQVSCLEAYENYQAEWGFFSGCRVMWDGVLTPVDIIREI